jgi:hypothetical protein
LCHPPALETATREAFKLFKARAFLVSSPAIGEDPGSLIYLEQSAGAGPARYTSSLEVGRASLQDGIAGHVGGTGEWHQADSSDPEPERYHPQVDLHPAGASMVTVPVRLPSPTADYPLGVVAVLQMVLGPHSPQLAPMEDDTDGICFAFAALWYLQLITPSVVALLSSCRDGGNCPFPPSAPGFVEKPVSNYKGSTTILNAPLTTHRTSVDGTNSPRSPTSPSPNINPLTGRRRSLLNRASFENAPTPTPTPAPTHTPLLTRAPSDSAPTTRDQFAKEAEENAQLGRQIAALRKENDRLKRPEGEHAKVFSAHALMEGVEGPARKSLETKQTEKTLKLLINETTKELNEVASALAAHAALLEETREACAELRSAGDSLTKFIEDVKEDEEVMQVRGGWVGGRVGGW